MLAAALALAVGCDDTPAPTATPGPAPEADASVQQATAWQDSERGTAAVQLTRMVARAFSDAGLRNRVKNDMRKAPFLEHKLEFGSYLKGKKGGILLAKMAQHSDRSKDEVLSLLDRLDPLELEFYMPYGDHRTSWTGGPEVVIASQFDEGQTPAAFTTGGDRYDLKLKELDRVPDRPVLALVPAETDFDDPLPPGAVINTRDRNGEAVGIYRPKGVSENILEDECQIDDSCGGTGNFDWSDLPPGLYMHDNWIDDLGEGGLKGKPELEAHLTAPTDQSDDNQKDIQCAGQEEPGSFFFNQDDNFFDGPVRVATMAQFDRFEAEFGTSNGMIVSLVEDDDTTCEIKMGGDRFEEFLKATAAAIAVGDAIRRGTAGADSIAENAPAVLRRWVSAAVNLIETADDEVGVIVEGANECAPDGLPRGWLIKRGSEVNGCTEMRMNDG